MADRQYHQYEPERDHGAHAPEAVDMMSPMTPGSNIERELQKQYQSQYQSPHGQYQPSLRSPMTPDDTEKEAVLHEDDGLHVVPSEHAAQYPETATTASPPTPSITKDGVPTPVLPDAKPEDHSPPPDRDAGLEPVVKKPEEKKIFGIRRKIFIPLAVVLVLVIAAAIGGGVGGAVASRNSNGKSDSSTTSSSSSTIPSSTSSTPASSTSSGADPTSTSSIRFLNNQTWPQGSTFAFQGFSRDNFTGVASEIITGDGGSEFGVDFKFDLHSYIWVPNIGNCCINFCKNSTNAGRTGYRCGKVSKDKASGPVPRIKIWCSDTHSDEIAEARGCDTPKTR